MSADKELVDYFIEHTNSRLEKIEVKVDTLLEFRWSVVGGTLVVAAIVSVLAQVVIALAAK